MAAHMMEKYPGLVVTKPEKRWRKYMRNQGVAIGAEMEKKKKIKKPFTPPIKKPRIKGLRWQPSLHSVEEISP
ncbi:hypothetical protein QJS10_CPA06g01159 [Acorus calamus]|uniref:Uncharacterized protein n=1 Tax=Acorus calamus TaxID=4465 RepID=A0AAV9END6_ACOCL|nr:hypothetical protein QJS10_CPA06g01159 [Acorus calamus]